MIREDGFCGNCRTYHRPDPRYLTDCPNPFVPAPRAPQPTTEQVYQWRQAALEHQYAVENAEKRREEEKRAVERGMTRAVVDEYLEKQDQQDQLEKSMVLEAKRRVTAAMCEEYQAKIEAEKEGPRFARHAEVREQRLRAQPKA